MGFPVYSTRFISGVPQDTASAAALTYTVPAGKLAIVRAIDAWCFQVGAIRFGQLIGGNLRRGWTSVGMVADSSKTSEHHWVFEAGNVMAFEYASGAFNVFVSGFILNQLP